MRKFARELGVDLRAVQGTGLNGRIFRSDVQKFVKFAIAAPGRATGTGLGAALDLAPWPKIDFAKFGEIETRPLSRIRRISKANLARNWVMIPHVTQFDEADVTELEALAPRAWRGACQGRRPYHDAGLRAQGAGPRAD